MEVGGKSRVRKEGTGVAVAKPGGAGAGRYDRLHTGKPAQAKASWEDAEADALWRAIIAVTDAGDAIMLGKTRDGGAVVLTVLSGDERIRAYGHDAEEIADLIANARVAAEES